MKKRGFFLYCVIALLTIFVMSGCETTSKKVKDEVSGIKTRVDTIESRVESVETKQAEAERAASEQAQTLEELKASKEAKAAKSNISIKTRAGKTSEKISEIQICLKNAGYYNGAIDGVKGSKTRKAIKEFQRANSLNDVGIVGSRTWTLLSKYAEGASGK